MGFSAFPVGQRVPNFSSCEKGSVFKRLLCIARGDVSAALGVPRGLNLPVPEPKPESAQISEVTRPPSELRACYN